MRLLNLGMPKSGTTTLQTALERAGLRSAHWYDRRSKRFVGRSMYRNYFAGRDPLADFVGFDAITQADYVNETFSYWPQMDHALLGEIRRHHPDCVFVLVTGDVSQIVSSFYRWNDLIDRLATTGAPGLPGQFARSPEAVTRWINGHYEAVRARFADSANFLEVDIEDLEVRAKIENALGLDLPWWGKANVNTAHSAKQ